MKLSRRRLVQLSGLGVGGAAVGAALVGRQDRAGTTDTYSAGLSPTDCDEALQERVIAGQYGSCATPPDDAIPGMLDLRHTPPTFQPGPRTQDVTLQVIEAETEIAYQTQIPAWTYNGTAPGPVLRATEGDTLNVRLVNPTTRNHTVHFHGSQDVSQDGWQPVAAGDERTYVIRPERFGLHPYHCHTPPYADHFSRGMYGLLIVDPPEGRAPAHEFVLALTAWDINGDKKNEIYTWNGISGYYAKYPLIVPVGELVRLYVANLVEHDPVGSFHLHAQTFDVFRSGTSLTPHEHTDIVNLGQTERAILEFRLPRRGRYMFHPHQIHMAEKGAMGWIVAV